MRKKLARAMALIFLLVMALSMTACSREGNAEAQSGEVKDPMVRLYYCTEAIMEDSCEWYEFEENWWEKPVFEVKSYSLNEDGEKKLQSSSLCFGDWIMTQNYQEVDLDNWSMSSYLSDVVNYRYYENGECVYLRSDMEEGNDFDHICNIETSKYDEYGRLLENTYQERYEGETESPVSVTRYEYTDTDTGSVGTQVTEDSYMSIRYYDKNNLLVAMEVYHQDKLNSEHFYEYNTAGCLTKFEMRNPQTGYEGQWKYLYETVEVPLSVAQKFPMFKWEYID